MEKPNKLWQAFTPKGKVAYTQTPNIVLKDILDNYKSIIEIKCALLISRWSFGFKREETCYLGLDDFIKEIENSEKSHISPALKAIVARQWILRGKKKGFGYKYAINLFRLGIQMKDYKICNEDSQKCNKDYRKCNQDYKICKQYTEKITYLVKTEGFEYADSEYKKPQSEKPLYIEKKNPAYINSDINIERNTDMANLIDSFKNDIGRYITKEKLLKWLNIVPEDKHGLLEEVFRKKWVYDNRQAQYHRELWNKVVREYRSQRCQKLS